MPFSSAPRLCSWTGRTRKNLKEFVPELDDMGVDLLTKMLGQYEPSERINARAAL